MLNIFLGMCVINAVWLLSGSVSSQHSCDSETEGRQTEAECSERRKILYIPLISTGVRTFLKLLGRQVCQTVRKDSTCSTLCFILKGRYECFVAFQNWKYLIVFIYPQQYTSHHVINNNSVTYRWCRDMHDEGFLSPYKPSRSIISISECDQNSIFW